MSWVDWPPGEYNPFTTPQTPPDTDILDTDGVCIRLNQDWIPAVIGALNLLTIPATWDSNHDFAMQQGEKIINEIATAAGLTVITFTLPPGSEPTISKVGCTIYLGVPVSPTDTRSNGGNGGDMSGTEQEDNMPQIIKIGGVAYLTNVCGCGDTELYRLSPANVQIDSKTGNTTVLSAIDSDKTGKIPAIPAENLSCFAEVAVPYLLARAYQFAAALETIIEDGVSALSGSIGDWLDIGGVVQMVLLGGASSLYELISGHSISDVEDAYLDSTFQQTMIDAWTATGDISRADLRAWVDNAPVYVGLGSEPESLWPINGWKMRYALQQWVSFSLLSGMADDLQQYAAECNSGTSIDDINYAIGVGEDYVEYESGGNTYPVWDWTPNVVRNNSTPRYDVYSDGPIPAGTQCYGLAFQFSDVSGSADWRRCSNNPVHSVHGSITADGWAQGTAYQAAVETLMENVIGVPDVWTNGSSNGDFVGTELALGTGSVNIARVIFVGPPL